MTRIELILLLTFYMTCCFTMVSTIEDFMEDEDFMGDEDENYFQSMFSTDDNGTEIAELFFTEQTPKTPSDVAIAAIYIAFTTLGLLANAVVIFVIFCGNEITKTVTAIYVIQLAIADCAFLIVLPFFALQHLHQQWLFSSAICTLCQTIKFINYYAGIFFLTAMSIDRYIAVVYSTRSRQIRTTPRTLIVCVGVWLASALASLPAMMYAGIETYEDTNICRLMFPDHKKLNMRELTFFVVEEDLDNGEYFTTLPESNHTNKNSLAICERENEGTTHNVYEVFRFVIGYLLPFIIITVNYALILVRLRRSEKKLSEANKNSTQTNSIRHKVTMMVIALVVCFGVCWLPHQVYSMLMLKGFPALSDDKNNCFRIETYLIIIGYSNSVLNPLLYTFLGHNFRKRLMDSWKKTRSRVQHGSRMLTKGQWRNTTKFQSASTSKRFSGHQFSRVPQAKNVQAPSTGFTTVLTEQEKDGRKTALLELHSLEHPEVSSKLQSEVDENIDHL